MDQLIKYLLQATLYFSVLTAIYYSCVRPYHNSVVSRVSLIVLFPVSILFPIITVNLSESQLVKYLIPYTTIRLHQPMEVYADLAKSVEAYTRISYQLITPILIIYFLGFLIFFIKFIKGIWAIQKLRMISEKRQMGNKTVYITDKADPAFSFFQSVFINPSLTQNINTITLDHELTHVKLGHSYDVIIAQIFRMFFWFNPLIHKIIDEIVLNHEYQADKGVCAKVEKTIYSEVLLNYRINVQFALAHHFACKSLHRRLKRLHSTVNIKCSTVLTSILTLGINVLLLFLFSTAYTKDHGCRCDPHAQFIFSIEHGTIDLEHGKHGIELVLPD